MKAMICALALVLSNSQLAAAARLDMDVERPDVPQLTEEQINQLKASFREFAEKSGDVLKEAADKTDELLFGKVDEQSPSTNARLRARIVKLNTLRAYHKALQLDFMGAQVTEDITEELVGNGLVSNIKYAPGLAVMVPLSYGTVKLSSTVGRFAITELGRMIGDAMTRGAWRVSSEEVGAPLTYAGKASLGRKFARLSLVPFKYGAVLMFVGSVPLAMGTADVLAGYHMYAMYLTKPEFEDLVRKNEAALSSLETEILAIRAELAKRKVNE